MTLEVRKARITDWQALHYLCTKELGYPVSENQLKQQLGKILADQTQLILVAENFGHVLGYVHLSDYQTLYFSSLKNVMGLAVLSQYQGKKIGTTLIQAAEQWAKEQKASGIRVNSGEKRVGAHQFYEALDYQSKKMQKNFFKRLDE
ncbi:hypothetical protein IGI37_001605 [Enterococcus sp. AZ194]|uniref:GNAT family N-acetyltransferase n=1 Tax=Enterococcus sp. AZ194 TaxID=2774629 RepID=UPI003F25FD79